MIKNKLTSEATMSHVRRVVQRARLVVFWEAIWPPLFALLMVVGAYIALSWLGAWSYLSVYMRGFALVIFAAIALYFIVRLLRTTLPKREQVVEKKLRCRALCGRHISKEFLQN